MDDQTYKLSDLSPHLFWDVDANKLTWEKDAAYIVERVLEYGVLNDWHIIKEIYDIDQMKSIVVNIRYLSPKSMSFICAILGMQKEELRCYIQRPLNKKHWIY